jgi:hypothetical protein
MQGCKARKCDRVRESKMARPLMAMSCDMRSYNVVRLEDELDMRHE